MAPERVSSPSPILPVSLPTSSKTSVLQELRRQLAKVQPSGDEILHVPTGLCSLDRLLPGNGLPGSSIVEWVQQVPGIPAASLALFCIRPRLLSAGCLAIVDGQSEFHAEAALRLGIPVSRLLLIRPPRSTSNQADFLWALEQTARCSGVSAVLCWIDRISSTAMRRLQLAVERSSVCLHVVRPQSALRQTSWADFRFVVNPASLSDPEQSARGRVRLLQVELVRSRTAVEHQGSVRFVVDCESGEIREAGGMRQISELAGSASAATATH